MKPIFFVAVAVLLVGVAAAVFFLQQDEPAPELSQAEQEALAEQYIRANISQLSPDPEVLGGTFYVTELVFTGDSTGTVSYEDGHIALVADFEYSVDSQGNVTATLSNVREQTF